MSERLCESLREIAESIVDTSTQEGQDVLAASDELERLRRTVRAINDNACAWHKGEDGKARALNVIAIWSSEALAGRLHHSVELITA